MQINITGKHIAVTEALKDYAIQKVSKLPKFFDSVVTLDVIIDGSVASNSNFSTGVEMIARAEHVQTIVISEVGDDAYKLIDIAVHKMERQLRKQKEKQRDRKHLESQ